MSARAQHLAQGVHACNQFADRSDSLMAFEQLFVRTGELADELAVTNQAAALGRGLPTWGAELSSCRQFGARVDMQQLQSVQLLKDLQPYMQGASIQANAAAIQPCATSGSRSSPRGSRESGSEFAPPVSLHKRSRTTESDELQDLAVIDPEKCKLEKRRAKNRRTAKVSRERKQAELSNLKAELAARTAQAAQLLQVIQMKDQQILNLAGMSNHTSSACQAGSHFPRWGSVAPAEQLGPFVPAAELVNQVAPRSEYCATPINNDLYGVFN